MNVIEELIAIHSCSRDEATNAVNALLSTPDAKMMDLIISRLGEDVSSTLSFPQVRTFPDFEAAQQYRFQQYGVPLTFHRYATSENNGVLVFSNGIREQTVRDLGDLDILQINIEDIITGKQVRNQYMLAMDVPPQDDRYYYLIATIVSPMKNPITSIPGRTPCGAWQTGQPDGFGTVEWYDEDNYHHVTDVSQVSNAKLFRKYF